MAVKKSVGRESDGIPQCELFVHVLGFGLVFVETWLRDGGRSGTLIRIYSEIFLVVRNRRLTSIN